MFVKYQTSPRALILNALLQIKNIIPIRTLEDNIKAPAAYKLAKVFAPNLEDSFNLSNTYTLNNSSCWYAI
jgi:hypothetical protein